MATLQRSGATDPAAEAVDAAIQEQHRFDRAHRRAYTLSPRELATYLKERLGRPVVARLTKTADANTVTRWSTGAAEPERTRVERMRIAVELHTLLSEVLKSEESAADWFTGANRYLGCRMPADAIRDGDYVGVFKAAETLIHAAE